MSSEPPGPHPGAAPTRRPRVRHRLRTPQEARRWRRRVLGYGLFGLAFVLLVNALIGENGYLATMRQRQEQVRLFDALARQRAENHRLREDIERLRTDPAALEEAARAELNMIYPGETMVVIRDQPPAPPAPKK